MRSMLDYSSQKSLERVFKGKRSSMKAKSELAHYLGDNHALHLDYKSIYNHPMFSLLNKIIVMGTSPSEDTQPSVHETRGSPPPMGDGDTACTLGIDGE